MFNDQYWAILGNAAQDAFTKIAAYYRHITANGISDGPAEDAGRDGLPIRVSQGVAIIPMMGPMIRRAGPLARAFGLAGTDSIRLAVESALRDPGINTILLRIDSPGGSVSGLDELGDVIFEAKKPVIAQVEGTAASAAYYVASQADKIMVGRNDLVGSIGTRMLAYDFSEAFEKAGIKPVVIDTGEFKSAGAMGTEITDAQIEEFQKIVDFYYSDFVSMVSRGREISETRVREAGDGRMFTPTQAVEIGLIDGVSRYADTLRAYRDTQSGRSTSSARARLRL